MYVTILKSESMCVCEKISFSCDYTYIFCDCSDLSEWRLAISQWIE